MKIKNKMIALVVVCSLSITPCSFVYATGTDDESSEFLQAEQDELAVQSEISSDKTASKTVATDDPGADRYRGNIPEGFFDDSGIQLYSDNYIHNSRFDGYTIRKGIDVSQWNGNINWDSVKQDGIEFAIVRGAYRGYGTQGTLVKDQNVDYNLKQAVKSNVPVGAYIFSQATTEKEAIEEANYLLDVIDGYDITLPLVMDFEYASDGGNLTGRLYNANLSANEATEICRAFCETIENAGYTAMVYANKDMLENDLNASQISKDYPIWLAHYTTQTDYTGDYDFWQCTSTGRVAGITGNVDINYWYVEPDQTKELVENNGEWLLYIGGIFQSDFTGLEKIESTWYYFENGKWRSDYTGLAEYASGSQYYVKNGIIQQSFTGLIKFDGSWYYIVKGKCQKNYTGLAEYSSGSMYYMKDGTIQYGFTGLIKLEGLWYYIISGRWQSGYEGLAEHTGGSLYYIKEGIAQISFTGLIKFDGSWYYIVKGKCQKNYTGLAEYSSGSMYYMKDGTIQYGFTGLIKLESTWYYVVDGKWKSNYMGLVKYSSGTHYYVKSGVIQHGFTGLEKLNGVWYYIVGGRWRTDFTGLAKYSTGSWFYVENGIIDYSFTGLVKQGAHLYYVKSGKWQKSFNGTVYIDSQRYQVTNGEVD